MMSASVTRSALRLVAAMAVVVSIPALVGDGLVEVNDATAQVGCGGCEQGGCACNSAEGQALYEECEGSNCTSCCLKMNYSCLQLNNHTYSDQDCDEL